MYAPFVISGIVWHELSDKIAIVNTNALKDVLNEHLQLDTYGALSGIAGRGHKTAAAVES